MHETSQTSWEQMNGAAPDHPGSLVEGCHGDEEHGAPFGDAPPHGDVCVKLNPAL